jgi:PhnB protein
VKLNTHLTFNGQCEAAFKFYEKCLGGKITTMLAYGDSPMAGQVPADWRGKIVHATLELNGGHILTGVDFQLKDYEAPKGFFILLNIGDPLETERIFSSLSEKGTVRIPLQKTFWSVRFGSLVDQYGIPWEINCDGDRP